MKKILIAVTLLGSFYNVLAQKTINDANAERREVTAFHGIDVSTGIKLVLTKGESEDVAVSASSTEYRDRIVTEVRDGILRIRYESKTGAINRKKANKNLRAYVSYKSIDKLSVTTGAKVEINGILKASTLAVKANTGGTIVGDIDVATLKVDQNTGSKLTLTGHVGSLEIDGDTGSKFMGEGLKTGNCEASVSTGAQVFITVEKELNAKASTGGYIKYKGEAGLKDVKTGTGGRVTRI